MKKLPPLKSEAGKAAREEAARRVASLSRPVDAFHELRMAMITSGHFWNGASIAEGAFVILEQVHSE